MKRVMCAIGLVAVMGLGGSLAGGHTPVAQAAGPPNATCSGTLTYPPATLPAGVYNNVTVPQNAACLLDASDVILGNLVAQAGSLLGVSGISIGGNLQDDHGAVLVVVHATIGGNLQVTHVTESSLVEDTHVGHDGQFGNNNGFMSIDRNTFGGNLQVHNHTGQTFVTNNTIANTLDCENNQPPPLSTGNTAKTYKGQCPS